MMRSVGQLLRSRSEQSQTRGFEREWGRTSESRRPESLGFVVGHASGADSWKLWTRARAYDPTPSHTPKP